jgi:hypothetical protein
MIAPGRLPPPPDSSSACRRIQDLKDLRLPEHAILGGVVEGALYTVADAPSTERMVSLQHFMELLLKLL